jgi:hypothetical protein
MHQKEDISQSVLLVISATVCVNKKPYSSLADAFMLSKKYRNLKVIHGCMWTILNNG